MLLAAGTLTWSWFGRVDTFATVQGKIVPVGRVQVVEPMIAGRVKAIHVRAGDEVETGQVLVELDPTEQVAERTKVTESLAIAEVSALRLHATIDAVERNIPADRMKFEAPAGAPSAIVQLQFRQMTRSLAAFEAEQLSLDADITQKRVEIAQGRRFLGERHKLVALTGERLDIYSQLEKRGVGIKSNTIDAKQGEQDQKMAVVLEEGRLLGLQAAIDSLAARKRERRESYLNQVTGELVEVDRTVAALRQDLSKADLFENASILRSPASGKVQQVDVNTLGDFVQPGQTVMIVVPEDAGLQIEAALLNKDKGFVREGDAVRIKVEAFPFTKYGWLNGFVTRVSNDAVISGSNSNLSHSSASLLPAESSLIFPIEISFTETSIEFPGRPLNISPGMSVSGDIKTSDRKIIEFMFDPLFIAYRNSFHEP